MTGFSTVAPVEVTMPQACDKDHLTDLDRKGGDEKGLSTPATADIESNHHYIDENTPVSLPEYLYWAEKARACEDRDHVSSGLLHKLKGGKAATSGNGMALVDYDDLDGLSERQKELSNARRVLRQAGWATVFYLVTCDILGPYNAPYAIRSIGMVPGVLLYVLFGGIAGIAGAMLADLFCKMDSVRFPIKTYGDLAYRIFGSWALHACSILQIIQLTILVGIVSLSNGQGLSQIITGSGHTLCFSVCIVLFAFVGMILGQIRGLKNYTYFANFTVWINLLVIFLSMGFVAHSPPNYASALATYGDSLGDPMAPVSVVAVVPLPVYTQVNGVFNMVFAYGGSMIFPEIMAEMRRPRDFIKGMAMAQVLIFCAYVLYGAFVYSFQGQYTLPLAYQGVSKYSWQTVGNVLALITGLLAAGLYGNIGLKVFYIAIIEGLFRGPPLMSSGGRVLWSISVVLYWAIAFAIGTGIPAVGALSGLVAAVCIFQFTYTFPPLFMLGFQISVDAAKADEPFTTPGVTPRMVDTWREMSRWKRGIMAGGPKRLAVKIINFWFLLASIATAGLGMWATGTALRQTIAGGAASSFGCTPPV